ncbi:hypothetical protein K493DRAFT_302926 [Basidiobolus meristosporus CBS 931.73]|uniref:Uncharacterized protein n=1 Tax=Basidiobolus meristosporus CBS 931.73 TaxID=1314790 RepID=A0A1Y1Y621_9FUNG|nr:hypothetical protein K493DRAFT_302926 [Basidiobolus meristosporus CBS 931.73]|eukprot:ORX93034.1 hypothetical protein K493DRAFT_302926 [Basidiobolus meristosporus CBS 931.73]
MRVLVQGLAVTRQNIGAIAEKLRYEFDKLQEELIVLRHRMQNSDVYASEKRNSRQKGHESGAVEFSNSAHITESVLSLHGPNNGHISYSLQAGLFGLGLLPREFAPSLVIITDGVINSSIDDYTRDILRKSASANSPVVVIQVGSDRGFDPGCAFGFVPDNEILRYIAVATSGKFLYAADCEDINSRSTHASSSHHAPNFYHRHLLFKETCFSRGRNENRFNAINGGRERVGDLPRERFTNTGINLNYGYTAISPFPWDPQCYSPAVEAILTRYRDYPLSIDMGHLLTMRLRQGFSIHSVLLSGGRNGKSEKIHINLALSWLPNVTIQYRIKALWGSDMKTPHTSRLKSPRIEINILAYTAFAFYFVNVQTAQYRDDKSNPLLEKALTLHKFLKIIFETDEILKSLATFNTKYTLFKLPKENRNHYSHVQDLSYVSIALSNNPDYQESFKKFWNAFDSNELYAIRKHCCDVVSVHLLLRFPSFITIAEKSLASYDGELLEAYEYLDHCITTNWKSFKVAQNVYIKTIRAPHISFNQSTSFCELRLKPVNRWVITIQLTCFNVNLQGKRALLRDLYQAIEEINQLSQERERESGSPTPLFLICNKPLNELLVTGRTQKEDLEQLENDISSGKALPSEKEIVEEEYDYLRKKIAKCYLRTYHSMWLSSRDDFLYENEEQPSLQQLAYEYLCKKRITEDFLPISKEASSITFYKEIELPSSSGALRRTCAVQYVLNINNYNQEVSSELWIEPCEDENIGDHSKVISDTIFQTDKCIIARLVTFDRIQSIDIRQTDLTASIVSEIRSSTGDLYVPTFFDVASLLPLSPFLVTGFQVPFCKKMHRDTFALDALFGDTLLPAYTDSHRHEKSWSDNEYVAGGRSKSSPKGYSILSFLDADQSSTEKHSAKYRKSAFWQDERFVEKDFAKLTHRERGLALFHHFMEKSIFEHVDGEIVCSSTEANKGRLFFQHIRERLSHKFEDIDKEIYHLAMDISGYRCFVKLQDTLSFMLIGIPSLHVLLREMQKPLESDGNTEDYLEYLPIVQLECIRPNISNSFLNIGKYNATIDSFESKKSDLIPESIRDTDHIRIFSGKPIDSPSLGLSDSALKFSRNLNNLYISSFIKSAYASLLQNDTSIPEKLDKAISLCNRSSINIDITDYLNVQTRQIQTDGVRLPGDISKRFDLVLGHFFEPIKDSSGKLRNMYYYRPSFKKASFSLFNPKVEERQDKSPKNMSNTFEDCIANIMNCSETPLFIRIECVFSNPAKKDTYANGEVCVPVSDFPTSYEYIDQEEVIDFSPVDIGTEASPLASADGTTATLKIVCLTLPKIEVDDYEDMHYMSPLSQNESTNVRTPLEQITEDWKQLASLSQDKQDALAETKDRLEWLIKEEIIHGLLYWRPVTQPVLKLVEGYLMTKNPFVDFPTSFPIPVLLVRNKSGKEMFYQELANASMLPYRLNRVESCFYVTEDQEVDNNLESSSPRMENGMSSPRPGASVDMDESEGSNCQGLGISMGGSEDQDMDALNELSYDRKQMFWLLLIPQASNLQICFYSKTITGTERSSIIQHARKCVTKVTKRVNRLILLRRLNETRICSKYLVSPDSESDDDDSSSNTSSEEEIEPAGAELMDAFSIAQFKESRGRAGKSKIFKPGEFECPIVYRRSFLLHWRLKPNQALNTISAMVLHPFSVSNRKNLFVVVKNDSVFYMKLLEVDVTVISEYDGDSDDPRTNLWSPANLIAQLHRLDPNDSPIYTYNNTELKHNSLQDTPRSSYPASPAIRKSSTNLSSTSATRASEQNRELILEVYGVDPPGGGITEELTALVESKLTGSIILPVISTFLARNVTLKLTRADVEFILPTERQPFSRLFNIPNLVQNPYAFLLYLKQNLLTFLKTLGGSDVRNIVKKHYFRNFGKMSTDDYRENESRETTSPLPVGELTFFYNCLPTRTPNPTETLVGQGVGGVLLTLLDPFGKPVYEIPVCYSDSSDELDYSGIVKYLSHDSTTRSKEGLFTMQVEMWTQGSINCEALFQKISQTFYHSLCDYFIEQLVLSGTRLAVSLKSQHTDSLNAEDKSPEVEHSNFNSVLGEEFVDPCFNILKQSSKFQGLSVNRSTFSVKIPPWIIDDFLSELSDLLCDTHPTFSPLILKKSSLTQYHKLGKLCYSVYHPFKAQKHDDLETHPCSKDENQYIVVCGIKDFIPNSSSKRTNLYERRGSFDSSELSPSRQSSVDDYGSDKGSTIRGHSRKSSSIVTSHQHQKMSNEDLMMFPNLPGLTSDLGLQNKLELSRSCFALISVTDFVVTLYTYNWNKHVTDQFISSLNSILSWNSRRMDLMDSILYQKMGLFYHTNIPKTNSSASVTSSGLSFNGVQEGSKHSFNLNDVNSLVHDRFPPRSRMTLPSTTSDTKLEESKKSIFNDQPNKTDLPLPELIVSESRKEKEKEIEPQSSTSLKVEFRFSDILKDAFMDYSTQYFTTPKSTDLLQRHGPSFLETYVSQAKVIYKQKRALGVYTSMSRQHHNIAGSPMSPEDLNVVLRTSRLLHFCRTPLLFSDFRHNLFSAPKTDRKLSLFDPDEDNPSHWYSTLAKQLITQYSDYLNTQGMHIIFSSENSLHGNGEYYQNLTHSKFIVSDNLVVSSPVIFLQKAFQGGILMAEVRIQGMLVCVNLYTVNRKYGAFYVASPGFTSTVDDLHSFKMFSEECARFKNIIHVNSFVHDFHLQQLRKILGNSTEIPKGLDILDIIRAFIRQNPVPPRYARNRVFKGKICNGGLPENLFQFIMKQPAKYQLTNLLKHSKPVACFLNMDHKPSIENTLIIFPEVNVDVDNQTLSGYDLNCYIIVLEEYKSSPQPRLNTSTLTIDSIADLYPSNIKFIHALEEKLDWIFEKALKCYERDSLWKLLWTATVATNTENISIDNFMALSQRFNSKNILELDPGFNDFLELPLNWSNVLDSLMTFYFSLSREIFIGKTRHLIIFNPHDHDFLVHFRLSGTSDINVYAVSREYQDIHSEAEIEHISDVIRTIGFYLWQKMDLIGKEDQ